MKRGIAAISLLIVVALIVTVIVIALIFIWSPPFIQGLLKGFANFICNSSMFKFIC
jgi:hypothetical protein